jgi:putative oxidoreductase
MLKKLFAPGNDSAPTNVALLVLRLWLGLTMLINHGAEKLHKFSAMAPKFPDPLGVGHSLSLALVVFAEVAASLLLVSGLLTRFAAFVLAVNMAVAFFVAHKGQLSGEHSGELAFIYLAGYITLLFAGGGRFSVDKTVFAGGGGAKARPAAK